MVHKPLPIKDGGLLWGANKDDRMSDLRRKIAKTMQRKNNNIIILTWLNDVCVYIYTLLSAHQIPSPRTVLQTSEEIFLSDYRFNLLST